MRFSVASGTDNSILQLISNSNDDIELHTHETDKHTRPYGVEGLVLIQGNFSSGGLGPHASTTRFTYTVPGNKIARLDSISISVTRATAAGTLGITNARCDIDTPGGVAVPCVDVILNDNIVGANVIATLAPKIILAVGDILTLVTIDNSTTGTVIYHMGVVLSEVDA